MPRKSNAYQTFDGRGGVLQLIVGGFTDYWSPVYGKYVVTCLHEDCGRNFLTDRPHTKYCSMSCKMKAYRARKGGQK